MGHFSNGSKGKSKVGGVKFRFYTIIGSSFVRVAGFIFLFLHILKRDLTGLKGGCYSNKT